MYQDYVAPALSVLAGLGSIMCGLRLAVQAFSVGMWWAFPVPIAFTVAGVVAVFEAAHRADKRMGAVA